MLMGFHTHQSCSDALLASRRSRPALNTCEAPAHPARKQSPHSDNVTVGTMLQRRVVALQETRALLRVLIKLHQSPRSS